MTSVTKKGSREFLPSTATRPLLSRTSTENFTSMIAAIGTGKISFQRPLVNDAPRLRLRDLPHFGKSVELRWENLASGLFARVTRSGDGVTIETDGRSVRVGLRAWPMPIPRRGGGGERERMVCPRCNASRDVLHWVAGEWSCRGSGCGNLSHASRHRQRYCPAIHRRARLLHKLSRYSPRGRKARIIRAQIAQQEQAMLADMRRVNRDLSKRMNRHGGQRRNGPG